MATSARADVNLPHHPSKINSAETLSTGEASTEEKMDNGMNQQPTTTLKRSHLRQRSENRCPHHHCRRHSEGFASIKDLDRHLASRLHRKITGKRYKCCVEGCTHDLDPRRDNFTAHCRRMHPEIDIRTIFRASDQWNAENQRSLEPPLLTIPSHHAPLNISTGYIPDSRPNGPPLYPLQIPVSDNVAPYTASAILTSQQSEPNQQSPLSPTSQFRLNNPMTLSDHFGFALLALMAYQFKSISSISDNREIPSSFQYDPLNQFNYGQPLHHATASFFQGLFPVEASPENMQGIRNGLWQRSNHPHPSTHPPSSTLPSKSKTDMTAFACPFWKYDAVMHASCQTKQYPHMHALINNHIFWDHRMMGNVTPGQEQQIKSLCVQETPSEWWKAVFAILFFQEKSASEAPEPWWVPLTVNTNANMVVDSALLLSRRVCNEARGRMADLSDLLPLSPPTLHEYIEATSMLSVIKKSEEEQLHVRWEQIQKHFNSLSPQATTLSIITQHLAPPQPSRMRPRGKSDPGPGMVDTALLNRMPHGPAVILSSPTQQTMSSGHGSYDPASIPDAQARLVSSGQSMQGSEWHNMSSSLTTSEAMQIGMSIGAPSARTVSTECDNGEPSQQAQFSGFGSGIVANVDVMDMSDVSYSHSFPGNRVDDLTGLTFHSQSGPYYNPEKGLDDIDSIGYDLRNCQ